MWLLGSGRHGLRGSRRHFRLQSRRTCRKVWWTSAPCPLLQLVLIVAPNPGDTRMRKCLQQRRKNWTENVQQNKAINKAAGKGSGQGKERLRKVKRENTREASVLFNISKSWKNLHTSRMVNTFNFRIFGLPKISSKSEHKRVTVFGRMELILFCCRMTSRRLDGSQPAFFRTNRVMETASRYFYSLFLRRTLAFPALIMLVTYLTHS